MRAIARAKYVRIGPRKVEQVLDLIRGKAVDEAYKTLKFVPKVASKAIEKVLHSAVSNSGGINNYENLYVSETYVCQGPVLKRMRPMAMGRGAMYKRKSCHITVVVDDKKNKIKNKR